MSESLQLRDPLFKLVVRFSNGEMIQHILQDPIEARAMTPDTRYAVISSFSCQNPSECTDITVINLRDVTYFKTERVTLDQLANERRMAGMHASAASGHDDKLPKTISQLKFI
ncbi:MAG TPA: hypothetical protein VNN73_01740 [Blastocatellia bacterium]|nr:hypothetical protein [Blastocatellia bacterium]